jgi:hypothetical protein
MATTPRTPAATSLTSPGRRELLKDVARAMFPHPSFPDAPYERAVGTILDAAAADVRLRAQLEQGLRDVDVLGGRPFAELDDAARLDVLRRIEGTAFFGHVRTRLVTGLYDQKPVWDLLGYEGPCPDGEGYRDRGFDDLDWLPEPQIVDPNRDEILR